MNDSITIQGAREHNLKDLSLSIPKNKLVVFTGVSGSGKSSLAFDTIYAEGQRRYVESLSSYARQFLGIMGKPDVDFIEGLSPAISIDQKSVSKNPRSTVGTITEIYDYLRLLYARIGHPHCPNCDREVTKLTIDEIVTKILAQITHDTHSTKGVVRFSILSPIVTVRKGEFVELFENLRQKGFSDVVVDGKKHDLVDNITLEKNIKHTISAVIWTGAFSTKDTKDKNFMLKVKGTIAEAVEAATTLSDGLVRLESEHLGQSHLYSEKFSCSYCNIALSEIEPRLFSFNSPIGACEECNGLGYMMKITPELVINKKLTINEGGILPFVNFTTHDTWTVRLLRTAFADLSIPTDTPLGQFTHEKLNLVLYGNKKRYTVRGTNRFGNLTSIQEEFVGIIGELERRYHESQSDYLIWEIEKYMRDEPCPSCGGKRLRPEALNVFVGKKNIDTIATMSITEALAFIHTIPTLISSFEKQIARAIFTEIEKRLSFLTKVGLGYLTIARSSGSLSGGEAQRIRLASQIGSGLTGVLYVLDEPSIGLHPKDVAALITSLKDLRDIGNTLIVVEHDTETIHEADHIVDFGPLAGKHGGEVIYNGSLTNLKNEKKSLTADYLFGRRTIQSNSSASSSPLSYITLNGATQFNLKNVNLKIPLSSLTCVTGVSGSGKSTLIVETLYRALKYYLGGVVREHIGNFKELLGYQYIDNVYLVDQSPIGKTPRSNPSTYIGAFDYIRDLFAQTPDAREKGFKKGRFSFNVKGGRCEKCEGAGTIRIEMQFLPDVYVVCDVCNGKRYNAQTLEVHYKGKTIYDVLKMTVEEATAFFEGHHPLLSKLQTLVHVGLSYIELGQPAPTLSGGEAQRIKLADELSKRDTGRTLYILDEPTTGLHPYDIDKLLTTLRTLVEKGNTVVVIEHNMDVVKNADYVVDLGPDGGEAGGQILYQGKVDGLLKEKKTYTGHYLEKYGMHSSS